MTHKISIVREKRWLGHPSAARLVTKAAKAALIAEGIDVPCEVSALLTDDEGIQALNREFRDKDRPTDVLSFPAAVMKPGKFAPDMLDRDPDTGHYMLGDMAISLQRARAQGREYGHGTERELMYLTVHSVLHLLGYDHEDEGEEKRRMREREKLIMSYLTGAAER